MQNLTYTYNPVGSILTISDSLTQPDPQVQTFDYDTLDRLKSASAAGGTNGVYTNETYTYDADTGNLETKGSLTLTYGNSSHKHAVTSASDGSTVNNYQYDANGNMTTRDINSGPLTGDYVLSYDAENRLVGVTKNGTSIASFVYDGDGRQVKATIDGVTTTYVGAHYEMTGSSITKYYFAGGQRVALRKDGVLNYLLGDHLGSSSITTDTNGVSTAQMLYKAWGEMRYSTGNLNTKYEFTGQRNESGIGLRFYNARWYDDTLGRFIQADSIVPGGAQGLDRYAYVNNSPVMYTDPSGHKCEGDEAELCSPKNLHVSSNPDSWDELDPNLRKSDDRIDALYKMYKEMWGNKDGWWWGRYGSGGFTIWEFMAIIWTYEQAGYPNTDKFVSALSNKAGAWCHSRNCDPSTAEGAMMFMSRYSQSARSRAYWYAHGKSIDDLFYKPPSYWADGGMQIVQGIQQSVYTGHPGSSALFDVGNVSLRSDIFRKMLRLGMIDIVWGQGKDDRLVILTYCQSLMVNYAAFNGGAKAINQRTYNNFCGG